MTRTPLRSVVAIIGAIVLTLALAGCGSSGGKALSTSAFKTKAQAICKAAQKDVSSYGDSFGNNPTPAQITTAVGKLYDRVNKEADDIAALKEPTKLSSDVDAMLKAVRAAAKKIKALGPDVVTTTENPFADANTKAKALGLDDCAS